MKLCVTGIGNLGAAIVRELLNYKVSHVHMYETLPSNMNRAEAEYFDLLPIAIDKDIILTLSANPLDFADVSIVTSGVPRTKTTKSPEQLFNINKKIVYDLAKTLSGEIYVATNPTIPMCMYLQIKGIAAHPFRTCTDNMRGPITNELVLRYKGYTAFTPAYAMVKEVFENGE